MTKDLAGPLQQIEASLQRLGRDVLLRALRPGIPSEAVRSSLGSSGLVGTAQVEELYGWHDGTSTVGVRALDDIQLFPGFYLLSIEDALANYRSFGTDERWMPGWLPIFANGGGDFYVVDLSPASESPIRHFRLEEAEHPIEYLSLGAMVLTLAQGFDRGIFFVDSNGYLEMDDLVFGSLAAELNPDVAWWAE